jgi:hypothetical protein
MIQNMLFWLKIRYRKLWYDGKFCAQIRNEHIRINLKFGFLLCYQYPFEN